MIDPVLVPPTAVVSQVKAQIRIGLATVAGMLVGKHLLPADLVNDQTLDYALGLVLVAVSSGWAWLRNRMQHNTLLQIAADPRNENVEVAPTA